MRATALALLLSARVLSACAFDTAPPARPSIALANDFHGFRDWIRVQLPEQALTEGHASSPARFTYLDRPAPPPGEPFEDGSILVKTVEEGDPAEWEIHAMVQRGGNYNSDGAAGWEFFALTFDARGELFIAWRGTGDERAAYLDPVTGQRRACTTCHGLVPDRDYVFERELYALEPEAP
ncbi:MAG: hypothetical protein K8H88_07760 [Sandaracinaceae bacterium]|nr:hypothetical protein [Sandaracinaceae bacterium]